MIQMSLYQAWLVVTSNDTDAIVPITSVNKTKLAKKLISYVKTKHCRTTYLPLMKIQEK